MFSLHIPRQVRRDIGRHQSQRGRIAGRHSAANTFEEAERGGTGGRWPAVVQESRRHSRQHEGQTNVYLDFRPRRFEVQELREFTHSVNGASFRFLSFFFCSLFFSLNLRLPFSVREIDPVDAEVRPQVNENER